MTARYRKEDRRSPPPGPPTSQAPQYGRARLTPRTSRSSKYAGSPVSEIPGCTHGESENGDFA